MNPEYGSVPNIVNVSPWTIEAKFNGDPWHFKPGEGKFIYDLKLVGHLVRSKGYLGLVHLVYDNGMQNKYANYEEFVYGQKLAALNALRKHKQQAVLNETQAMKDAYGSKGKGLEVDLTVMDVETHKKDLAIVDKIIADHKKTDPKKKNGPTRNKNTSAAEAGRA